MPPEEKESLKCRIEDLKVLMNSASEEIKNGANAMQIIALIKEMAKLKNLLIVPGESFGCKEFVRISYCVSTEQIENSLPAFKKLIEEYK